MEALSKQVSSLTARAANTQNQQLALIQEENKKLLNDESIDVKVEQICGRKENEKFCQVFGG